MKNQLRNIILGISAFALITGCSGAKDAANDAAAAAQIAISGQLNASTSSKAALGTSAVTVANLEIYGVAFSNPPEAVKVPLNADGTFEIKFSSNAAGSTISLIFRDKNDPTNEVGVVKFVDNSNVDMNGNAKTSSSIPLSGTVSLGTLSVNDNGEVLVDVASISTNVTDTSNISSADAFDFGGVWKFSSYGTTLPDGYSDICAADQGNVSEEDRCHGPADGMTVYMQRLVGKDFTPDATCIAAVGDKSFNENSTCGGTTGDKDRFGIAVWQSEAAFAACGSKLGFTLDEAKAFGKVDLTSAGFTGGKFTYTAGWTDGWKKDDATTSHEIHDCQSVPVTMVDGKVKKGFKCTDTNSNYEIHLENGCTVEGSDTPIRVTDWDAMHQVNPTCTEVTDSNLPTGFNKNSCVHANVDYDGSGPAAAANVVCVNAGGRFNSSDQPSNDFDWNNVNKIASGTACSAIPATDDKGKLQQLRCYADYYHQNAEDNPSLCVRDVRTNWEAATPGEFLLDEHGPATSRTQYVMEKFEYAPDGQSGTFNQRDVYTRGVQTGNSWSSCRIAEDFIMSFKKETATVAIVEMQNKTRLVDKDKKECVANVNQLGIGISKTIMKMTKQ